MTPYAWLKQQGGTGIFVKTKRYAGLNDDGDEIEYQGGGMVFIAAGETARFSPASIVKLVKEGKAIRDGNRVTLLPVQS